MFKAMEKRFSFLKIFAILITVLLVGSGSVGVALAEDENAPAHGVAREKGGIITGAGAVKSITRFMAAGARHSFAIRDDGTLWAWGNNDGG